MFTNRDCIYLAGDHVFMFSMDDVIHLVMSIESHVISEIPRVPVLLPLVLVAVAVVAALCGSRASFGSTLQATTSVRTGNATSQWWPARGSCTSTLATIVASPL